MGMPLVGLLHDISKFRPSEWFGYVEYFYGDKQAQNQRQLDLASEYGAHELIPWGVLPKDRFEVAWNHHQNRNPHHWDYWVHRTDAGAVFPLPMPERYMREMLADWRAMGRQFGSSTVAWYAQNKDRMLLRPETRRWIERHI